MRPVVRMSILCAAIALAACACGGGPATTETETQATENAGPPKTLPAQGPLSAGTYRTKKFQPAFTLEVGKGWVSGAPEFGEAISIVQEKDGAPAFLTIANPRQVFDPEKPAEEKEIPAPDTVDGWLAWYQRSPYLEISNIRPASIDGAAGKRFDLAVNSTPKKATEICGAPCVPGFPVGPTANDFYLGSEEQDYVLEIGGEIVIVVVNAPEDEFDKFLPNAQKVLDTVNWEAQP